MDPLGSMLLHIVQIDRRWSDHDVDVGLLTHLVEALHQLCNGLLAAVHLPVASDEELPGCHCAILVLGFSGGRGGLIR